MKRFALPLLLLLLVSAAGGCNFRETREDAEVVEQRLADLEARVERLIPLTAAIEAETEALKLELQYGREVTKEVRQRIRELIRSLTNGFPAPPDRGRD